MVKRRWKATPTNRKHFEKIKNYLDVGRTGEEGSKEAHFQCGSDFKAWLIAAENLSSLSHGGISNGWWIQVMGGIQLVYLPTSLALFRKKVLNCAGGDVYCPCCLPPKAQNELWDLLMWGFGQPVFKSTGFCPWLYLVYPGAGLVGRSSAKPLPDSLSVYVVCLSLCPSLFLVSLLPPVQISLRKTTFSFPLYLHWKFKGQKVLSSLSGTEKCYC